MPKNVIAEELAQFASSSDAWVGVGPPDSPLPAWVRLGMSADGRLICTGLVIGDTGATTEITVRKLRAVPLGALLDQLSNPGDDSIASFISEGLGDLASRSAPVPINRGPKELPDELLDHVLAQYRRAVAAAPSAPFKHLRDQGLLHGSDSTLRRQVRQAKKREAERARTTSTTKKGRNR